MTVARGFTEKYQRCVERHRSVLCVGLDPDPRRLPPDFASRPGDIVAFNHAIIDATRDLVCAYKPNLAFYEALGDDGWAVLRRTLEAVPPFIPVILDAKRGDVGHTAERYAAALLDDLGADAVTVNPLMGTDSLEPFLKRRRRGVFVLCLTSNPSAREFQLKNDLHLQIAKRSRAWAKTNRHVGLVVGATRPQRLREIRALCPDRILLVPGVGAQGGGLAATLRAGVSSAGPRLIINASRSIIHASRGDDFAEATRREAQRLQEVMEKWLTPSTRSTRSSAKS